MMDNFVKYLMEGMRESCAVTVVGIATLLYIAFIFIRCLWWNSVYFRRGKFDFALYADGGYALITGGAGGIGKSCAEQFAKRGINLLLVDFNSKLLAATAEGLKNKYPSVDVQTRVMDLTKLTKEEYYKEFEASVSKLKIGILFNNAGIAEYKLLRFTEDTHKEIKSICELNAIVPTLLTKMVMPNMLERKRGLIMTMSSASAVHPCSILPVYGSTKAFVLQLAKSIQNAYPTKESGIVFHTFHPQFVRTPMTTEGPTKIPITGMLQRFIFPDCDQWMISALKTVGQHNGASWGWFWFEPMTHLQLILEQIGDIFQGTKEHQRDVFRKMS